MDEPRTDPASGEPSPAPRPEHREPLDRVMLAMDVVDTLRHQQLLVDRELDEERREREFKAQIQAIYAAQGIEVADDVIADAIAALREDRFTYTPPRRTFTVRLAEIYVERGKWTLRAALVAVVAAVAWAIAVLPGHYRREGQIDTFREQVAAVLHGATDLSRRLDAVDAERAQIEAVAASDPASRRLLGDAAASILAGRDRTARIRTELTPPPDAEQYPDRKDEWDLLLARQRESLDSALGDLGVARGLLDGIARMRSIRVRLAAELQRLEGLELSATERAELDALERDAKAALESGDAAQGDRAVAALRARVDDVLRAQRERAAIRSEFASLSTALSGVEIEADARAELQQLRSAAGGAIDAADWSRARDALGRLRDLTRTLDQSYELRILSRPDDRSGVWRHPDGDTSRRNYYVIVEAIGPDGRPVRLQVRSEEDQTVRDTSRFGIRVPEAVYERVKADKLDNGLVDDTLFGTKRRGMRAPEYRFETSGGRITSW